MTAAELETFLGIKGTKDCDAIMARITPQKRALYEIMANLETAVTLWQEGLGPKPAGVIICGCGCRGRRHRR